MKRLQLVILLLSACDDSIPGLCKVDSDCATARFGRSVCSEGVCVAAEGLSDGGESHHVDSGIQDGGVQDAESDDGSSPFSSDGGGAGDAGPQDAALSDGGPPDAGAGDAGGGGGLGDAGWQDAGPGTLGAACNSTSQCQSGYCADGVCCDAPCNDNICQRCDSYSTKGSGHCGASKAGTDPDHECQASATACSGSCNLVTTTYSCLGSSYACASQQTTTPIASGYVCAANSAAKVSETNNCGTGSTCADGACQATQMVDELQWARCVPIHCRHHGRPREVRRRGGRLCPGSRLLDNGRLFLRRFLRRSLHLSARRSLRRSGSMR